MRKIDSIVPVSAEKETKNGYTFEINKNEGDDEKVKSFVEDNNNIENEYFETAPKETSQKRWLVVSGGIFILFLLGGFTFVMLNRTSNNDVANVNEGSEKSLGTASSYGQEENRTDDEQDFYLKIKTNNLEIKAPVVSGNSDADLNRGVVHQQGSVFPNVTSGNVVLTGHRWYPGDGEFSKVFLDLDKLKVGDIITLQYLDEDYKYIVTKKYIVDNIEDNSLLKQTIDPMLTIYTCTPKYTSKKRLVYQAKLVK